MNVHVSIPLYAGYGEAPVENYIIRIYRYEKDNPRRFVGTAEKVGRQGKQAFTTLDELWEILNASVPAIGTVGPGMKPRRGLHGR